MGQRRRPTCSTFHYLVFVTIWVDYSSSEKKPEVDWVISDTTEDWGQRRRPPETPVAPTKGEPKVQKNALHLNNIIKVRSESYKNASTWIISLKYDQKVIRNGVYRSYKYTPKGEPKVQKSPPPESYSESAIRELYKCIHLNNILKVWSKSYKNGVYRSYKYTPKSEPKVQKMPSTWIIFWKCDKKVIQMYPPEKIFKIRSESYKNVVHFYRNYKCSAFL